MVKNKIIIIFIMILLVLPVTFADINLKVYPTPPEKTKDKILCISGTTVGGDIIEIYIDDVQQDIKLEDGNIDNKINALYGQFSGCIKLHDKENKVKVKSGYGRFEEFTITYTPDKKPIPIYDSLKFSEDIIEDVTYSDVTIDIIDEEDIEVYADFTATGDYKRKASCSKNENIHTCTWNDVKIDLNENKLAEIILDIKDSRDNQFTTPILYQLYKKSEFSKNLKQGWNLISIPLVLEDDKIENVFSSISGKYDRIFAYDNGWKDYSLNKPLFLNTLTTIDYRYGYWIYIKQDAILKLNGYVPSITNFNLQDGWNLISYPSLTLKPVKDLEDLEAETIFAYDNDWKSYSSLKPDFLNSLINLEPGFGYWIKTNNLNFIYED